MSGHSKWSSIKHKKAVKDARRGKLFSKLIKELTVAARLGGGGHKQASGALINGPLSVARERVLAEIKKSLGQSGT